MVQLFKYILFLYWKRIHLQL